MFDIANAPDQRSVKSAWELGGTEAPITRQAVPIVPPKPARSDRIGSDLLFTD